MNAYLIQKIIKFDYKSFPWINKKRAELSQKHDIEIIAAHDSEEAKEKYMKKHSDIRLLGIWSLAVDGFWNKMCDDPNWEIIIKIEELSSQTNLRHYMQYMSLETLQLLKNNDNDIYIEYRKE